MYKSYKDLGRSFNLDLTVGSTFLEENRPLIAEKGIVKNREGQ